MPKNESTLYKAFGETLVEYFQKTSLNGFGLLYYIRRRKYQRIFWFMFILMGISFAAYVCVFMLIYFLEDPTVTILGSQTEPIWSIPFPAVAVCSANKLSRRAAENYIREINSGQIIRNWSMEIWLQKIKLFAAYFDTQSVDVDEAMDLQEELLALGQDPLRTSAILRRLAPSCEQLVLRCHWAGSLKACTEIFSMHATPVGNCCIFNYQCGNSDKTVDFPYGTGIEMGLTLLLNASSNDYLYTERNALGFSVQLFATNNFPDASTGEVQEFHVMPGEDVAVQIFITTQETTGEVQGYSASKRNCFFANEHERDYGTTYSKASCLSHCKARSILALCGCIPFYVPFKQFTVSNISFDYCTLAYADCLERYSVTWNTFNTLEYPMSDVLQQELQDSITCRDCLPLCSYYSYRYRKQSTMLSRTQHLFENARLLESIDHLDNISLVKLYFSSEFSMQYRKNVVYNWYQILSNIGGVIGICIGCSCISGFEIIYFTVFRYFENVIKLRRNYARG